MAERNKSKSELMLPLSPELLAYSHRIGRACEDPVLARLAAFATTHEYANMNSALEQVSFIQLLVRLTGARRFLEVGVFLGYTTLAVAQALPADGKVVGLELRDVFIQQAEPYWIEAGVRDKIDIRLGPAVESMEKLSEHFDLIYIDCDKPNYSVYVRLATEKLIRPGGLILVDNTLWKGSVIDPEDQEPNTVAIRAVNEQIHDLDPAEFKICNLPVGDGLTMILKL